MFKNEHLIGLSTKKYLNKKKSCFFFVSSSRDWTEVVELPARDSSYTVPNLKEGDDVSFRIIAVNGVGSSEPSKPTDAITVQDQPGISFYFFLFIFNHSFSE